MSLIVPSADLCKSIPKNHFVSTILMWYTKRDDTDLLIFRPKSKQSSQECIPAPTLQQIIVQLQKKGCWDIGCYLQDISPYNRFQCRYSFGDSPNAGLHYSVSSTYVQAAFKVYKGIFIDPPTAPQIVGGIELYQNK